MVVSIRQTHPVFVGEVSGVDIARPLTAGDVAAIDEGMTRSAVLVFHDQKIPATCAAPPSPGTRRPSEP